jgi:hypothetical protein
VLAAGSLALPFATPPAHAQAAEPERALATPGSPFNLTAVQSLLARGDAAAAGYGEDFGLLDGV